MASRKVVQMQRWMKKYDKQMFAKKQNVFAKSRKSVQALRKRDTFKHVIPDDLLSDLGGIGDAWNRAAKKNRDKEMPADFIQHSSQINAMNLNMKRKTHADPLLGLRKLEWEDENVVDDDDQEDKPDRR